MNSGIVYAQMRAPVGTIWIASTRAGVCTMGIGERQPERFFAWLSKRIDPEPPREEPKSLEAALTQLREYFSGSRRAFDLPLDVRGTVFQKAVWDEIARVPYGATTTYGEIAQHIGKPNAARAVGAANGANPLPIVIPCHRVIGADGSLTGYGGGLEMKAALLRLEGVFLL
jgi:O-6-methylguanine DNA methyltransferase